MLNSTKVRDPPLVLDPEAESRISRGICPGQQGVGFTSKAPHLTQYGILVCELASLENQCMLKLPQISLQYSL